MNILILNILANDPKPVLINKIEFNFAQLLSLGTGSLGPSGPSGEPGLTGPSGYPGPIGPSGNSIFVQSGVAIPEPIGYSSQINNMKSGDLLITQNSILQLTGVNPQTWVSAVDFSKLASGLGINIFTHLYENSRVIKPRVQNGFDLTNSHTSTDPNYRQIGLGRSYQTVLYNFDETKTYSLYNGINGIQTVINRADYYYFSASNDVTIHTGSPYPDTIVITGANYNTGDMVTYSVNGGTLIGGLTNNAQYYIKEYVHSTTVIADTYQLYTSNPNNIVTLTSLGSGTHKFTNTIPNSEVVFPATSNLSVYNYFVPGSTPGTSPTQASEFQTGDGLKGFRNQIELGSIDSILTSYPNSDGSYFNIPVNGFLISPSFENLKIRKFRIVPPNTWSTDPKLGQYYLRAEYDLSSAGSLSAASYSPRSNSEQIWKINKSSTLAGQTRVIQMKLSNSNLISFNYPDNLLYQNTRLTQPDGLLITRGGTLNTPTSISSFGIGIFTNTNISNSNSITGIQTSPDITKINFSKLGVQLSNTGYTSTTSIKLDQSTGDLKIGNQNSSKKIGLNNAIVVAGNRLAAGVPFPQSVNPLTNPLPVLYQTNTDQNTLYEYLELNFTPTISFGTVGSSSDLISPVVSGASGKMIKVGDHITFSITFNIRTGLTRTNNGVTPPYYLDNLASVLSSTIFNLGGGGTNQHIIGNESNQITIKGIPNHWPDLANGGDQMKFEVELTNLSSPLLPVTRNWPMLYSVPSGGNSFGAWIPPVPGTTYAKFGVFGSSSTDQPELNLFCFRQGTFAPCKFSIADLYNPDPQLGGVNGSIIQFTINGTYLTRHKTAEQEKPFASQTTTTTHAPVTAYTWVVSDGGYISSNLACGFIPPATTTTTTSTTTTTTSTTTTTTTHAPTTTTRGPLNINITTDNTTGVYTGEVVKLGVTVYNGTGNYTYHWTSTPGCKLFGSTTASPTWFAFSIAGDYTATCTVTDLGLSAGHNTVTQMITITVL